MNPRLLLLLLFVAFAPMPAWTADDELRDPIPAARQGVEKANAEVQAAIDAFESLANAEASAGRFPEDKARDLRVSLQRLRSSTNFPDTIAGYLDQKSAESNKTLQAAEAELYAAVSKRGQAVKEILNRAEADAYRFAKGVWQQAGSSAQIEPALTVLRAIGELRRQPQSPNRTSAENFLKAAQRFLTAWQVGDADGLARAVFELQQGDRPAGDLLGPGDLNAWLGTFLVQAKQRKSAALKALLDAIVRKAVGSELSPLADAVDAAAVFEISLQRPTGDRRVPAELKIFRSWANVMDAVAAKNWSLASKLYAALETAPTLLGPAAYATVLETGKEIDRQIAALQAAEDARAVDSVKSRLNTVKDGAGALKLADELRIQQSTQNRAPIAQLENDLRQLGAAWSSESQIPSRSEGASGPWRQELSALWDRMIREKCARQLKAGELLAEPLAAMAPSQALRHLAQTRFDKKDWRGLAEVLGLVQTFGVQGRGENEEYRAVRALVAGLNFERAEQFTEAAASYRAVLVCIGDFVPVGEAAERLKALKRDHPEALTNSKVPMPGF